MNERIRQQVKNKLLDLVNQGVKAFPKQEWDDEKSYNGQHSTNNSHTQQSIFSCQLCSLSLNRKHVVTSKTLVHKNYFVLAEFPQEQDEHDFQLLFQKESQPILFSQSSLSHIALRLLERLGIAKDCHTSFAIKCRPEKGIPKNSLETCASNHLAFELNAVKANIYLCFGSRALDALWIATKKSFEKNCFIFENQTKIEFLFNEQKRTVYYLPSLQELHLYPSWRQEVWKLLQNLGS